MEDTQENIPPTTQLSTGVLPKVKTFWIFILALIVIAGIVSWTAVLFYPKQTTKNLPASVSEMENWKTYRNEEYGFEFKYPEELTHSEIFEGKTTFVNFGNDGPYLYINHGAFGYAEGCDEKGVRETIILNGISMIRENFCGLIFYKFNYSDNNYFFADESGYNVNKFDQILSTFRFVEAIATTTAIEKIQLYPKVSWKEVSNIEYYPNGFPLSYDNEKYKKDNIYKYGNIDLRGKFWSTNYSYITLESDIVEYYKKNLGKDLFKDSVDVPDNGLTLYAPEYSGDNGFGGYYGYLQVKDNKFRLLVISHLNGQLDLFISDEIDFSTLSFKNI